MGVGRMVICQSGQVLSLAQMEGSSLRTLEYEEGNEAVWETLLGKIFSEERR